jgi:hypothetical protein
MGTIKTFPRIIGRLYAGLLILVLLMVCSSTAFSAIYRSKNIDHNHFSATLQIKGTTTTYRVNVVFIEKKANLVFSHDQTLLPAQQINQYLTLYLQEEEIKDPKAVVLLELIVPTEETASNKDSKNWKVSKVWIMELNL